MTAIRVELPPGLCTLAGTGRHITVHLDGPPTQRSVLDALERQHPALRGTLRDHATQQRRPFVRFFAGERDLSHCAPDEPLPAPVAEGRDAFVVIGAIAGG